MLRVWPMVGRQDEKEHVLALMSRRPGGSVVLAGRAGVGKTRLATAVADDLADQGYVVERLVGTRAASRIPLGAIGTLVAKREAADGTGILQTMASVHRSLHEQAEGRPVLVAVDDAHCLDDASAAVIHQLVVAGIASILITVRTGEPGPDAVTAVWKDGLAEIVELQPLADQDLRALLEAVLGGPVDEPTALGLVRSADGNCLFLREMIRTALDDGSLQLDQGLWRLRKPVAPGPRLVNLVEARLLDLPPATRDVIELTAVGEPLPLALLEELVPADALAHAGRRELIDTETDGRRAIVRLAHPLYGEVVRARLPWLGMRARCRTLSEALEATGLRRHEDVPRFADWRLDANLPVGGERLMAAITQAQAAGDMEAAERFASAAVEAGTVPDRHQVAARVALSEALNHRKRFAESLAVLDTADPGSEPDRILLTMWRANTLFQASQVDEALDLLDAALAGEPDPLSRAFLVLSRALQIGNRGRLTEALAILDEVAGTREAALVGNFLSAMHAPMLALAGRFDEAQAMADLGIENRTIVTGARGDEITGLRLGVEWADAALEMAALGRGDMNEAERLTRRRLDTGLHLGHHDWRRSAAASAGLVLFLKGDITAALPLLIEGVDDRGYDVSGARSLAWAGMAASYAIAGDLDKAAETLQRAAGERRPIIWFEPNRASAEALLASRRGLPSEARAVLTAALAGTRRDGNVLVGLYLAFMASRVGLPDLAVDYLRGVIDEGAVDGPFGALLLRQAEALIGRDVDGLVRVADEFEANGLLLPAVEMLAEAAAIEQSAGRSRPAQALRTRANVLVERCPGVDPTFIDRSTAAAGLTARELEVARLAAAGLSSAEIAERLELSVRTVDTHLGRVYFKLGVTGRAELRDAPELRVEGG